MSHLVRTLRTTGHSVSVVEAWRAGDDQRSPNHYDERGTKTLTNPAYAVAHPSHHRLGHENALASGTRLNQFTLGDVIGRGGFGVIYWAYDTQRQCHVAIKEFLPSNLAVRDEAQRVQPLVSEYTDTYQRGLDKFVHEAHLLATFDHPNIVKAFDVFRANNTAYLVMEYLNGQNLSQAYKASRVCDETQLTCILAALLDALETVHARGYIHGDIKPSNIFVTTQGRPVLLDFGSARLAKGSPNQTQTAMVSPGYAPFEQYHSIPDNDTLGPWTDIYALACSVYRGMAGKCYADALVLAQNRLTGKLVEPYPASLIGHGRFSTKFLHGIDIAMRFNYEDRPQTIKQWRAFFKKLPATGNSREPLLTMIVDKPLMTEIKSKHDDQLTHSTNSKPVTKRRTTVSLGFVDFTLGPWSGGESRYGAPLAVVSTLGMLTTVLVSFVLQM